MTDLFEKQVDAWMRQFASIDDREHVLPDPSVIWLKARVMQSVKDEQRASRPMTIAQITSYTVVAACWAIVLTWKWAAIQAWLDAFRPSHVILGAGAQQAASVSMPFLLTLIILGSATVIVAMQSIFAEE